MAEGKREDRKRSTNEILTYPLMHTTKYTHTQIHTHVFVYQPTLVPGDVEDKEKEVNERELLNNTRPICLGMNHSSTH